MIVVDIGYTNHNMLICGYCGGDGAEDGLAGSADSPTGHVCLACVLDLVDGVELNRPEVLPRLFPAFSLN